MQLIFKDRRYTEQKFRKETCCLLVFSPPSTNCIWPVVTRLEISIVITTVIIPFIIACRLNSVSIVAHGRFDVIVAGTVVSRVVDPSLETSDRKLMVLILRLRHNWAGRGEEFSLIIVILMLRSCLLRFRYLDWWLSFRIGLLGEVKIWDGYNVMRPGP